MKNDYISEIGFIKHIKSLVHFFTILILLFCFSMPVKAYRLKKDVPIVVSEKSCYSPPIFATIQPVQSGLWYQSSTWPGGVLPTSNDDVVVPVGITLTMAGTCRAKSITVNGKLRAVNWQEGGAWVDLETKYIMVMGNNAVMEIGTENQHYQSNLGCRITLTGSNPNELIPNTSINSKAIMVMNGATLEMHGKPKKSWVKIGAKALVGDTSITLSEPVDWEVGDKIVITSNRLNPYEAEEKTITAITSGGTVVSFNTPIAYPRMGELKNYSKPDNSMTWNVDTRVEVGLLSRNITIQGDDTSPSNGFGGHIMIMNNSSGKADNIELHRMGQKAKLARYPWHWHMLENDSNGQYLKNSSINVSYNRAVTIHGSWATVVDNNVAYDHIGHGIFLEDGSEINNTISNNLVLLTRRAADGENLLDTDRDPYQSFQNSSPSSFWITNPQNTFTNNIVAGTDGTAYWFAFPDTPTGLSANDSRFSSMQPANLNLIQFDGNVAHSAVNGIDINDRLSDQHELRPNRSWNNSQQAVFNNLTFFSNYFSLYAGIGDQTEDVVYNNIVSTDVLVHLNFATRHIVQNSIFIADTDAGLLDTLPYSINGLTNQFYFYRLYDGAARVYDSHFVNWNRDYTSFFRNNGAAQKRINHLFSGLSFNHDGAPRIQATAALPQNNNANLCPQVWSNVIRDLDGSLTRSGVPSSIVSDIPFNHLSSLNQPSNWNGLTSVSEKFVYCRFPNQPVTVVTKLMECGGVKVLNTVDCNLGGVQQLHLPLDHSKYEHSIYLNQISGNSFNFTVESELNADDGLLIRFKGFGNLNGVNIENISANNSINSVLNSNTTAYFNDGNDLLVKFVTTNYYKGKSYKIQWNSGSLPSLTPEQPVQGGPEVTVEALPNNGGISFTFPDTPNRSNIEFSVDDLASFPYNVNDNIGTFQATNLSGGTHNIWARWGDNSCPVFVDTITIPIWEYNTDNDFERWTMNALDGNISGGNFNYNIISGDPKFISTNNLSISASEYNFVRLRIKTQVNGFVEVFWARDDAQSFSASRRIAYNIQADSDFQEILIPISQDNEWINTIYRLRIDLQFPQGSVGEVDLISLEAEDKRDCLGVWNGANSGSNCTLSVSELDFSRSIIIHPVPAKEHLSITLPTTQKADIQIISMLGQVLHQDIIEFKEHTLSLDKLNAGVYFLRLHIDGKKIQKRFVKY